MDSYVAEVADTAGGIDVSFNAVMYGDVQGTPLLDMPTDTFAAPLANAVRAQLATTRAAARRMAARGSGAILTVTGYGPPFPGLGTTAVTWQTVESLCRQWAVELGPSGVRVAWVRIGGTYEGVVDAPDYGSGYTDAGGEALLEELRSEAMLRRLPNLDEVGDAAAFLASDRARSMTSTAVNLTAGTVSD